MAEKIVPKKHIPMRMCIVTHERRPKAELARFVYNESESWIYFDPKGKTPGRGANIKISLEIFDMASQKGAFNRAFKKKISDENLIEMRKALSEYIEMLSDRNREKKVYRVSGNKVTV